MIGAMALITPSIAMEDLADADIIIEAVFEEMAVKKAVFADIDRIARPDAILTSNTSYLDIDDIAAAMPDRHGHVLGTHFFSPANVMRLLEVVRTANVSAENLATVMALARRMGKLPIVAGVCHGFIGNRMLEGYFGGSFAHGRGRHRARTHRSRDVRIRHGDGTTCGHGPCGTRYRLEQAQGCRWRHRHRTPRLMDRQPSV